MKFKQALANLIPFTLNVKGTDGHFIERHFEAMYSSDVAQNVEGDNHCYMEVHFNAMCCFVMYTVAG